MKTLWLGRFANRFFCVETNVPGFRAQCVWYFTNLSICTSVICMKLSACSGSLLLANCHLHIFFSCAKWLPLM